MGGFILGQILTTAVHPYSQGETRQGDSSTVSSHLLIDTDGRTRWGVGDLLGDLLAEGN